jgi:thiol-disulfide isomerase/thioredoxin
MVRRGYSTRPAVLGRSRGGLWASAWAIAHPDLTAGVGGIYPVYDWRTYPGLVKAAPAYGLSTEQLEARAADLCPIERIDAAARAGVPFCIIHGDDDKVVPLGPNSAELKKRYEAAGQGELVTLIVVPGQGHSFWEGFFRCQPLVDFLIARAKGRGVATAEAHEPAGTRYPVMSGVGLSLRQKAAHILVGSVLPGGPAARSDVIAPDMRIVSVTCEGNTTLLEGKTIGDAVSLIRGPVGTALTLTIAAADGSEPREVALVRGAVPMVTEATSYGRQVALIHQLRPFQFEYGASSYEPFIGKPIPDLALTSIGDATPARPADFRGKVLVLDLWASWCPACYGPVDKLQTLAARHPDWAEKVVLATVSIDDKAVDAAAVFSQQGWRLTQNFHCDPTAVDALGIKAVPVVIVIKADGTVAAMGEAHAVDVEREVAAALAAP